MTFGNSQSQYNTDQKTQLDLINGQTCSSGKVLRKSTSLRKTIPKLPYRLCGNKSLTCLKRNTSLDNSKDMAMNQTLQNKFDYALLRQMNIDE